MTFKVVTERLVYRLPQICGANFHNDVFKIIMDSSGNEFGMTPIYAIINLCLDLFYQSYY